VEDLYQFDDGRVGMDVLARYYKVRPAPAGASPQRGRGRGCGCGWLRLAAVD
jgi:hypothetical protein